MKTGDQSTYRDTRNVKPSGPGCCKTPANCSEWVYCGTTNRFTPV